MINHNILHFFFCENRYPPLTNAKINFLSRVGPQTAKLALNNFNNVVFSRLYDL